MTRKVCKRLASPSDSSKLASFEEALKLVLKNSFPLSKILAGLDHCLDYALAEDVSAPHPIPPFDSSAVDGYAVYLSDIAYASANSPAKLKISGEVSAGAESLPTLRKGETIRIFTGAPVPKNADAIVMREFVEEKAGYAFIKTTAKLRENIRFAGEEYKKGELIFGKGTLITPAVVGMLASIGRIKVSVVRKPKIAIITTGDEVVEPREKPKPAQVRNANLPMLSSALKAIGIEPASAKHLKDTKIELSKYLREAIEESDIVFVVGGVSVGDYDYVKAVLKNIGVKEVFWRVAIKPGKPFFFGTKGKKLVFGLPGNPVSAMVCFVLFAMPAIRKTMGIKECETLSLRARLNATVRKKAGRAEFLRGKFETDEDGEVLVRPLEAQGSHMLGGLADANCFIVLHQDRETFHRGARVKIIPLFWRNLT